MVMKRQIKQTLMGLLLAALAGSGLLAAAQWRAGVSERQVQILLNRIETRSDNFRQSLAVALNRSNLDNTAREDFLNRFVANYEQATNRLQADFRTGRSTAENVQEVLNRAAYIDSFMRSHRLSWAAERDWNRLRADLNLLARYYNVPTRWNDPAYGWMSPSAARLTGTYRLDEARSENVRLAIERATATLPASQRERLQNVLMRRLRSPEMLAIDRRGQTVTIASTLGRQLTLTADGRSRYESNARVHAAFSGDQLVINTDRNRNRDYSVTFDPEAQGSQLRVTRSITVNQLARPVVITSLYHKTSDVAQLNLYDERNVARRRPSYSGSFYVPNGTRLVAVLNNNLDTERTRVGDRFTMIVRSPNEYDGAILEGYIADVDRAGPFTGRADLTFDFERIRLPGGRSYDFAANIVNVRTPGGDELRIDEGRIEEENSQTEQTITRTGIGAALGAIIGAITGGGEGAAIGAAVGAGAGAGSVFVTGRDDLELPSGSEFVLRASAPRNALTSR
jgi:hypothetical protein